MEVWLPAIVALIASIMGSTGMWAYLSTRDKRKDASIRLLLGIAHDRIIFLGMSYLDRGWLSKDEYEDLIKYLYAPYSEFGGNGLAEKVMDDVRKLPIKNNTPPTLHSQIIKERHVE